MLLFLGILEGVILIALSLLHLNWAFGGLYGFDKALPTNVKGERVLNPKKRDSAIVALGLLFFGLYYFIQIRLISVTIPEWIDSYVGWFVVVIFFVRAIGDFRYIGFFKRIKNTEFGKLDSAYYSPLTLGISLIGLLFELIS